MNEDLAKLAFALGKAGRTIDFDALMRMVRAYEGHQAGARMAVLAWAGGDPTRTEFLLREILANC